MKISKTAKNLFVNESHIGVHVTPEIFEADMVSFTFYPKPIGLTTPVQNIHDVFPKLSFNSFSFNGTPALDRIKNELELVHKDNILDFVSDLYLSNGYEYFFVGFDLDVMGQLMASLLYYHLISKGADPEKIIRIPLTDEGYITGDGDFYFAIGDFYDLDTLLDLLDAIRMEQLLIWRYTRLGFRKMEILKKIVKKEYPEEIERRNEEINTYTYITKTLLEEK